MTTRYAVLNPNAGGYEYVDNKELCLAKAKELAWQFYLTHTHNSPVSQVEIDESGAEVWSAVDVNTL